MQILDAYYYLTERLDSVGAGRLRPAPTNKLWYLVSFSCSLRLFTLRIFSFVLKLKLFLSFVISNRLVFEVTIRTRVWSLSSFKYKCININYIFSGISTCK